MKQKHMKYYIPPWEVYRSIKGEFYVPPFVREIELDYQDGLVIVTKMKDEISVDIPKSSMDEIYDNCTEDEIKDRGLEKVTILNQSARLGIAEAQRLDTIVFVSRYSNRLANWLSLAK